ncbi:odorant receptor 13a-like isoform X2 [Harpegnathos saltator]|uniref:odorant receptor 13a-like isoform X2 n=1 Tax=Harpegnathos saltator TaxID=610380 RepID=UPI000DBEE7CB|nr:odorant receptor 13a-like isoform X2 [Harpegnathos saltator]
MERHLPQAHINMSYEQDIKYVMKPVQYLLRILGIWPLLERDLSTFEMMGKILLITLCCLLVCIIVLPGFLYSVFFSEDEPHAKLMTIEPVIYSFVAFIKYGTLITYENKFKTCLRHVKDDWKFVALPSAREIMIEKAKIGRNVFTVCCIMLYCAGLSFHTVVPLTSRRVLTDGNVTFRPLAYAGYYIVFDEQRSPAYEIMFLLQLFSGFVMYSVTIVLYGLIALLVMHACAQMKILMMLMEELVSEQICTEENVNEKLSMVVEHQIRIRNYVLTITDVAFSFLYLVEDTMRHSSLFEILGSTIMMCLVGYCILMEWRVGNAANTCTFFIVLVSDAINIFLLCYVGEHVTEASEEVAWKTHMLGWYRLPSRKTRDMVLIIIISHIPLKITAGKFIVLSFKTFGDVVKSAVVYFNLLCTVSE